ncbi:uncharacterized protein KY384_007646 [Bacidia gigantensis]|uniref:uncharacterized protein n=1 Tax=Bacidia gigantensis TaxID=2732470 RepID=UPI001D05106A|nr:uncharacterized protein KY384_007646 [Bacidia gigantensis]KAG8527494.1 hypothetical protein KY384_007646 [Bacidia gigantensis]
MMFQIRSDICADFRSFDYFNFGVSLKNANPTYTTAIAVFGLCMLHLAIVFLLSLVFKYLYPSYLRPWAEFLGVFGTILAAIQFLPQIWTTWKLQEVGSLSIPSMCIQTPGSFVWVGSLAARLGWDGWSTWGIYLCTGILQGILLSMSISFEIRDWKRQKQKVKDPNEDADENPEADERTGLIGSEQR